MLLGNMTGDSRRLRIGIWLVILLVAAGCRGKIYQASRLPPELLAPASPNLDKLNLSGLSDQSVSAEVIQPGDVLDVTTVTDFAKLVTTTTPVRVAEDGSIIVPLVGRVQVGGLEVQQAEKVVNAESIARGVFRNPSLTVTMKQCRVRNVTVVGAVNKPGKHELPRGSSSLMTAILAADGLSKDAGTEVEIRHTDSRQTTPPGLPPAMAADGSIAQTSYDEAAGPAVVRVDLALASTGAYRLPDLRDGDVVHVSKRNLPPVHVMGLVRKPGEYAYPANQELRVLDAIALAGGHSNPLAEDVIVIRQVPNAPEPARIAVSIQAAKNGSDNLVLAPGDTISVEQSPVTMTYDVINTFFRVGIGASVNWF